MLDHISAALSRHHLLGHAGVVALSGGPDSVALTLALVELCRIGKLPHLTLAHLNHQLRGAESDGDEAFVRALHASFASPAITLCCESRPLGELAQGDNLEATARRVRYEWLTRVAQQTEARWLATGHTADDQAETVLHHLLRGSGVTGLAGIAERRPLGEGVELVRPLLAVERQQVLAFLAEHGQCYRVDSSNADLRFTRNRIRHELLPLLATQYNPAIAAILSRLAQQASTWQQVEADAGAALLAAVERPRAGGLVILDTTVLRSTPRWQVRAMLRQLWQREQWPMGAMGFDDWERVAAVAEGASGAVDLPGGIHARRRGRVLQLGP